LKCYELQGPSGINGLTLVDKPVAQPGDTLPSIHARRMSILQYRARPGGYCTCWRERPTPGMIEFGTSFGISTLHLAAALRDNGGGKLITTEFEERSRGRARISPPAALPISLKSVKAMRWKRWRKACLNRSILYCWMALRGLIQTSCRWSRSDYAWAR
jgi:hypothetical protein